VRRHGDHRAVRPAARRGRAEVRPGRNTFADGARLIAATVLAHGSLVKAIAMVILGLLLGLVGTDVNSGVARFSFACRSSPTASASSRWRWACSASRDHRQPRAEGASRDLHQKVSNLLPSLQDFKDSWHRSCAVPLWARSSHSAGRRRASRLVRRLYPGEEDLEELQRTSARARYRACGARIGEQRRRPDFLYPLADSRHSLQPGHGVMIGR